MHIFFAIISFIFIYLDYKKTNIFKLTFASSFMFLAIFSYKFPNNYVLQISSFLILNFVFYFLIKNILKKEQADKIKNNSLKNYKNKIAIVTKDIGKTLSIDGLGAINIDNQIWSAKSIDDKEIKKGQKVQIISKENMILNVKAVEYAKNK